MTSSGHSINETFVYGPVTSRRYGTTIGINLLPQNNKVCNFDCVYCQLGTNSEFKKASLLDFPSATEILVELRELFSSLKNQGIDNIVISGNGEPTLHPKFAEMIAVIRDYARKIKIPLVCLTNGTRISDEKIATALKSIDECALKFDLDAHDVNRPLQALSPVNLVKLTENFQNLTLQCCLTLTTSRSLNKTGLTTWLTLIKKFNSKRIDFYSLSRKPAVSQVHPISKTDWALVKKMARAVLPHRPLHFCTNH